MKILIILLAMATIVVVSNQQQQLHRTSRPRGLIWLTPYSPSNQPILGLANYQSIYSNPQEEINEIPWKLTPNSFRRKNRPAPIPFPYLPLNEDVSFTEDNNSATNIEDDEEDEYSDIQSRIKWFKGNSGFQKGFTHKGFNNFYDGRFLYSSTINNPFYKTATFTVTSTVTTLGSLVICVPANNLVAVPAPTCSGRKKREIEDSEDNQFPIAPSETLKLIPTALPSADAIQQTRESRVNTYHVGIPIKKKQVPHKLLSSKEDVIPSRPFEEIPSESTVEDDQQSHQMMREERLFGGGYAASTTLTSYSFVGATVTSTVLLDPTGMNVAVCLPSGYVVC